MKILGSAIATALLLHMGSAHADTLGMSALVGSASDIGVSPRGEVWVIGTDPKPQGFGIHRLEANKQWNTMPGDALRIDVGPNGPVVVNRSGYIYTWTGSTWQNLAGRATDVGIGADGTIWIIGTNPEAGGYDIYRLSKVSRNWEKIPGSAVRIDVAPDGNAWVVNRSGQIYRFNGTRFVQVAGSAIDVTIGANGAVYALGGDSKVYYYNGGWAPYDAGIREFSAGPEGKLWAINAATGILAGGKALPPSPTPPRMVPPPPPRIPGGVTAINDSKNFAWITLYQFELGTRGDNQKILASGCLMPTQESSWDIQVHKLNSDNFQLKVRFELTHTEDCAPLPGNRHVKCDTSWTYPKSATGQGQYVIKDGADKGCNIAQQHR